MKETYELRVVERRAHLAKLEKAGDAPSYGIIKVNIDSDDPRVSLIRKVSADLKCKGQSLFFGWSINRKYTKDEISAAELFWLKPKSFFEPEGEYGGTIYDEGKACPKCGAGAEQVTPLYLPLSRIPKSKDFSQTIANEMVVSQRFVDLFRENKIAGATFKPVTKKGRTTAQADDWYQLQIDAAVVDIVSPTQTGLGLFEADENGEFLCPNGDLIGLNILSEFTVSLNAGKLPDIFCAKQYLGNRRGVLRPWQPIFVSPRLRKLIVAEKLKGLDFEVAYVR
jgi:hypothetical protein